MLSTMLSIKVPSFNVIKITPYFNENIVQFSLKNVFNSTFTKKTNEYIPFMSIDDPRHSQK